MPLDDKDWPAIIEAIRRETARSEIVQAEVKKADPDRMLIWVDEFGDVPIPIFAFDYQLTYYYDTPAGTTVPATGAASPYVTKKRVTSVVKKDLQPLCPKKGETVLITSQHGTRRLPRCIGVLRSRDF